MPTTVNRASDDGRPTSMLARTAPKLTTLGGVQRLILPGDHNPTVFSRPTPPAASPIAVSRLNGKRQDRFCLAQ